MTVTPVPTALYRVSNNTHRSGVRLAGGRGWLGTVSVQHAQSLAMRFHHLLATPWEVTPRQIHSTGIKIMCNMVVVVVVAFFLVCEGFGRMFNHSLPTLFFFFKWKLACTYEFPSLQQNQSMVAQ